MRPNNPPCSCGLLNPFSVNYSVCQFFMFYSQCNLNCIYRQFQANISIIPLPLLSLTFLFFWIKKSENLFGHTPFFILLMNFANLCYRIVSEFFFSPVLSHDCVTTGASSVVPAFCSTYRNKLRGSPIFLSHNLIFSLLQRLLVLSCMKS